MAQKVNPIPDGYHSITPYLFIKGAAKAIDFYKQTFGAREELRIPGPDNTIGHAEISIGGSRIMLADESPAMRALSPETIGGSPVMIHVYVPDVDAVVKKAMDGGARLLHPVEDKFYGDRNGTITDPFGHIWGVATHIEDVSPEEIQRRLAAFQKKPA